MRTRWGGAAPRERESHGALAVIAATPAITLSARAPGAWTASCAVRPWARLTSAGVARTLAGPAWPPCAARRVPTTRCVPGRRGGSPARRPAPRHPAGRRRPRGTRLAHLALAFPPGGPPSRRSSNGRTSPSRLHSGNRAHPQRARQPRVGQSVARHPPACPLMEPPAFSRRGAPPGPAEGITVRHRRARPRRPRAQARGEPPRRTARTRATIPAPTVLPAARPGP